MRARVSLRSTLGCGVIALLLAGGCGSSPIAPAQTLNVAGTWTGTWQFVTSGVTVTDSVTATLTQGGTSASGTWAAASGAAGSLSFAVASSISGTWTITQTTLTGFVCTASASLAGTATSTALAFTAGTPASSGACQWASNNQFALSK